MKADRHVGMLAAGLALLGLALGCSESEPASPAGGGDERPLRILSLTPNVTEILFAMGLGDKVVGRSTCCDEPPEARALPAVGDTISLDVEKIVALGPTLAFVVTRQDAPVLRLESLGIRTVALESDTMPELVESIGRIGRETGCEPAARHLLGRIRAELDAVRESVRGRPRPRTLFMFPMTVGSMQVMVAGRGTFVDDLLEVAGAVNAFPDRANWPAISPQRVIELAPEVILVHAVDAAPESDTAVAIRRAWSNWQSIPAVAAGRVHVLSEPFLTIPGPRVGRAARLLAETLHPELREEPRP